MAQLQIDAVLGRSLWQVTVVGISARLTKSFQTDRLRPGGQNHSRIALRLAASVWYGPPKNPSDAWAPLVQQVDMRSAYA